MYTFTHKPPPPYTPDPPNYQRFLGHWLASPAQMGWICPRCNKVHAPSVLSCECADKPDERVLDPGNYTIVGRD